MIVRHSCCNNWGKKDEKVLQALVQSLCASEEMPKLGETLGSLAGLVADKQDTPWKAFKKRYQFFFVSGGGKGAHEEFFG